MRTLRGAGEDVIGLDIKDSPWTDRVGSISDAGLVAEVMANVSTVFHTATLHKPHVATHSKRTLFPYTTLFRSRKSVV